MLTIEIGRRHYLLYLILPHPLKMALLSPESRRRLDVINQQFNANLYSGDGAEQYEAIHRYGDGGQQDYPSRLLVGEIWARRGFGRALEVGAGSGYFTSLIARRAESLVAVEPVADMQARIKARCAAEGLANVQVVGGSAFDLEAIVPAASLDSVLIIQSFHHLHRRDEVLASVARVLKPGGRLFMVEPHHNIRRVVRLARKYVTSYRSAAFQAIERNWATHDFVTCGEIRTLCRRVGLGHVRLTGHWIPFSRLLVKDPARRTRLEAAASRAPGVRHAASVLAIEAERLR